jgi:hypothetical protein
MVICIHSELSRAIDSALWSASVGHTFMSLATPAGMKSSFVVGATVGAVGGGAVALYARWVLAYFCDRYSWFERKAPALLESVESPPDLPDDKGKGPLTAAGQEDAPVFRGGSSIQFGSKEILSRIGQDEKVLQVKLLSRER